MGRYYTGNITGKFWKRIQSSYDPEYFGCEYENICIYLICNCKCNDTTIPYCKKCYQDENKHRFEAKDQIESEIDSLIVATNEVSWSISYDKIDFVKAQINKIEKEIEIDLYIENIVFDLDNGYWYTYQIRKEIETHITREQWVQIAKWLLGQQIFRCLIDISYCHFTGET